VCTVENSCIASKNDDVNGIGMPIRENHHYVKS